MNIGYDAKRAFQNKTGLGNYSRSLLKALLHFYPQHQYTLYAPRTTNLFNTQQYPQVNIISPQRFIDKKLPSLWRSGGVVKDIKTAGIHIYHGLSNELPAGINKTAVKSVVTVHDLIFERYPATYHFEEKFVHRWKIKKACAIADIVIAASLQTRQDLIDFYKIPERKISVCYQSCNPSFRQLIGNEEKERIKVKYSLPPSYFLAVGSIAPRKNLLAICKAMLILKDKMDTALVIIGDGKKEKKELKSFMHNHGMDNRLLLLNESPQVKDDDFLSTKDFPAIYQQAQALIYPSIFEGFGIPLLEAFCSGLPVISSNTSSLPEVGGEAALYFSPHNYEELAQQMLKIVTDKSVSTDMREKGFQQAQKFTDKQHADVVMQVYQQIV